MAEILLLFVGDFSKWFPTYMMFPFKAMMICKIQLGTENQLGKGQEKVLLPFKQIYKMQPNTELHSHCQVFLGTNIETNGCASQWKCRVKEFVKLK